jgi:ribonuclease VapC
MVVDSSAVLAVMLDEPDQSIYLETMKRAPELTMSAPTLFECRLVALRKSGAELEEKLLSFIEDLNVRIIAFDEPQAALAAEAFRRYGKGRAKAALNFGDCFSYALARHTDLPLLYKGGDFARTDVAAAI